MHMKQQQVGLHKQQWPAEPRWGHPEGTPCAECAKTGEAADTHALPVSVTLAADLAVPRTSPRVGSPLQPWGAVRLKEYGSL